MKKKNDEHIYDKKKKDVMGDTMITFKKGSLKMIPLSLSEILSYKQ